MPTSRRTSSVSPPSAGAAPLVSAGVRESLIGAPTCFTEPMPGWSSSTIMPRAPTSSDSTTSSRSRIGSRQQSLSPANVVQYVHDAAKTAIDDPKFAADMANRGIDVDYRPGKPLHADLWREYKLHTEILQRIGMLKN